MASFKFVVEDQEGLVRRGLIQAPSQQEAEARIASRGFRLVELSAAEDLTETLPSGDVGSSEPAAPKNVARLSLGGIATTIQVLPQLPKNATKLSWRQRLTFSKPPVAAIEPVGVE